MQGNHEIVLSRLLNIPPEKWTVRFEMGLSLLSPGIILTRLYGCDGLQNQILVDDLFITDPDDAQQIFDTVLVHLRQEVRATLCNDWRPAGMTQHIMRLLQDVFPDRYRRERP